MEINVEVPDSETPPVETPAAAIVVAAPAPEGTTDLAVSVGTLLAKMETVESTLNSVKYTAEDALSTARLALERQAVVETPAEPIEEVIVTPAEPSGDDEPAPKSKRHWLAEILL
jgi:hypothetical protein